MKKILGLGLVIISIVLILGCVEEKSELEQACLDSGGTVVTGMCCLSIDDFPNICVVGACGCAPEYSHEVKVCDCGEIKCFNGSTCVLRVSNFQDCVDASYPVMESYPRQCMTPDGRNFVEGEERCIAPTGESMSLFETMRITVNSSECGNYSLEEPYLRNSMCNADTGTWWIDLDIEMENCNPACVVDIVTEQAEINYRCTGVLP